jgi:hypothetical protein
LCDEKANLEQLLLVLCKPVSESFFDVLQSPLELSVLSKHRSHPNEGTHDNNTRMNRDFAAEDISGHDSAMLGKHIWPITTAALRSI